MKVMHPLHGKVVLITGGSSGIGQATARRLAGCGARVALAARTAAALDGVVQELVSQGAEALAVRADVTDREQCRQMVDRTVAHFGSLDVLICSAGLSMRCLFADSDLEAAEQVFRVNFLGTLFATYFALPHVRRTRGSLIAISSLTGLRGTPTYSVYGASKFAVEGLYDSLRLELAPDGVHVGVVAPGFVDTPLRERVLGPGGRLWAQAPPLPFRLWPVDKCVDRLVNLIVKRRRRALLPAFVRPLLALDGMMAGWLGDRILARQIKREDLQQGQLEE
jgi:NAD(P)-dependent dehydrogenase (short-subunit alcohol dehydrogenase family)